MKKLFTGIVILAVLGCSKDEDTRQPVPTTAADIQKAQSEAFGNADPLNIKAGEFVYTIQTQQVFSSQEPTESLMQEESLTITDRQEFNEYIEFTLVKELIDHTEAGSPHYKFKDVLYLAKYPQPEEEEDSNGAPEMEDPNPVSIEYFNLSVTLENMRKPKKVLEREPCNENDGSCYIKVHKINYDIRYTAPPEKPQTSHVETWISQDVPYLAAVLQSCFRTIAFVEDARPMVRQCTTVLDYKFE